MKNLAKAVGRGFALGALAWGVGCAQGGAGSGPGFGAPASDGGVDATLSDDSGAIAPGDDAGGSPGADASGDDGGGASGDATLPGDVDAQVDAGDDAAADDAGSALDAGGSPVDAGQDAGGEVDAGHDAGADAGHDAGTDAGTDAGHDAGVDSGVDAGPCSPAAQTGCPSGESCSLNGASPVCVTPGPVATGGLCSGTATCAADNLCASDGTHEQCRQFCSTDANCTQAAAPVGTTAEPGNGPHCVIDITGTNPTVDVCTVPCNPVATVGTSGCPTGLSCLYTGTSTIPELTDCETPGTVAKGGTCTATASATLAQTCGAELVCVVTSSTATTGTCRAVCRAGMDGDCAGSTYCNAPSGVTSPMFGFCCPLSGC